MAHIGKSYPYLNRSQVIAGAVIWPFWAGTEYNWSVGGWDGIFTDPPPSSGRGLLPTAWSQGERSITYECDAFVYLGGTAHMTLVLSLLPDGTTNDTNWTLTYGGVQLWTTRPLAYSVYRWDAQSWDPLADLIIAPGPNVLTPFFGMEITPVAWYQTPAPPMSSPF